MTAAISVVVPVFNRAATILATLDSVAAQSLQPNRLVVVDDGSTDSSVACVSQWLQAHSGHINGQLLTQPNRGVAAARNRGLAAASPCSLIAFLDSDDRWPNDFLERAKGALDACSIAVAATADREFQFGNEHESELHDLAPLAAAPVDWMLAHGAGIASSTLFRTTAVRRHGGFDEKLRTGEDSALFLPMALDGPWLHVPGRPVAFERGLSDREEVAGHLSKKYQDQFRTWARVKEDFVLRWSGKFATPPVERRRLLHVAWYAAGRELMAHNRPSEARQCFVAALRWNPWSYKNWKWLARSCVRGDRESRDPAIVTQTAAA